MGSLVFCKLWDEMCICDVLPRGVVHVGAHKGEEVGVYAGLGFQRIVLFEPNQDEEVVSALEKACRGINGCEIHPVAIGNRGERELVVPERSQQASFYELQGRKQTVTVRRLDDFDLNGCNVLVVDVQGAELEVLKSGSLAQFDMVIVEADFTGRFLQNPFEMDDFLDSHGFELENTYDHDKPKGVTDAVYVRRRRGSLSSCAAYE
jgi:FkbM family methyltransferase